MKTLKLPPVILTHHFSELPMLFSLLGCVETVEYRHLTSRSYGSFYSNSDALHKRIQTLRTSSEHFCIHRTRNAQQ